jgi:glyoxylase-like metal-dependent hydrolase (beta-lactamase superfamily II)
MSSSFVSTRRFGGATVSIISDGSGKSTIVRMLEVPEALWRPAAPDADAEGEVVLGYNVGLVQLGDARVLIDLGFDEPSPSSAWKAPRHQRSPGVEAGLAALGTRPEDVTHVLITHAHGDHVAGGSVERDGERRPRYPRARHLIQRLDWEGNPARQEVDSMLARHLGPVELAGLLEPVDGDREVVPGVTMLHAPGESPGHAIVRVASGEARFYFVGDLFHHPCEVEHLDWVSSGRDQAAMERSRRRLVAEAVPAGATLVFTHRPFPGWGRIVAQGDGYRWVDG